MKNLSFFLFCFCSFCFFLTGCGPGEFIVKSSEEDKFADPNFSTFYSLNNRLTTKSSTGGIHIDDKGIFLNPIASVNKKKASSPIIFGFSCVHYSYPEFLFLPVKEVIFLTDKKERVVVGFENYDGDFNLGTWNSLTKSYNSTASESATGIILKEDFFKISNSSVLEVKVVGGKRNLVVEKEELEEKFISNLKQFEDIVLAKSQGTTKNIP
jgi:hypothetical protein